MQTATLESGQDTRTATMQSENCGGRKIFEEPKNAGQEISSFRGFQELIAPQVVDDFKGKGGLEQ